MIPYRPERILIQEQCRRDPVTKEILERLPDVETRTIQGMDTGPCSRNTLVLMRYPGKFLKQCQGSGAEICCNYFVVSYAWNCHIECTYCVLQSYLNSEALLVCTNIEELMAEVQETLARFPRQTFRIGTGELADSLALDHITGYSRRIIPFFASLQNGILELKTKSDQISNLQDLDHRGHTIISWSMNSKRICRTEELKAATFEERLAAAVQCQEWGYKLGFHFDPLIHYEQWETEYRDAVREIFRVINPANVAWISLGALRFPPHLRDLVHSRFPASKLPYGEFVPGHHGKLRYFRPIREEMYRKMRSWVHEEAPKALVYLCMESRVVWDRVFGYGPHDAARLSEQLDLAMACRSLQI
jgi:spore photoproduct lyase